MPEGHTIHREVRDQTPMLKGKVLRLSSPQGRFADGAALLDGRRCLAVEAYGKHLVYGFEGDAYLHIHLGLYGKFRKQKQPATDPRGAVRLRMASDTHCVDVNGPNRCEVLDPPGFQSLRDRIGPDVLRADADPDRAFARISKSRAPIGALIMDQAVMAGIGNIYRTELLWRRRLDPLMPGRALTRDAFDALWSDAAELLQIGVKHNAIITVEGASPSRSRYRERVNIFAKDTCPACDGPVTAFGIAGRRAFSCNTCQPRHAE